MITLIVLIGLVGIMLLKNCTPQGCAKNYGGEMTITMDPGQKLEMVTWKRNQLWLLTRPMKEGDEAETYLFQEDSNFGILEGEITIIERK
jgi:hypothetical protein